MEYCGLGSVRDIYVLRGRGFPENIISLICKYALKGLKILHSLNKIHRDIKADNILVTEKGQPKLGKAIRLLFVTLPKPILVYLWIFSIQWQRD